jgi:uncharacterized repeat protein (TIGR04052 family)
VVAERPGVRWALGGLLALGAVASGCDDGEPAAADSPVVLRFAVEVAGVPASCGTAATIGGASVTITDLRWYVHDVVLLAADGSEAPLQLDDDGVWQDGVIALLDGEDGTGGCAESGTAPTRLELRGTAPDRDYTGVRFKVGVPFELNHLDVGTAAAPLDQPSMYWAWQAGYKFMRIDLDNGAPAPGNRWYIHLGSTDCASASAVTAPTSPCGRPNIPTVELRDMDPRRDTIVLDVAGLVAGADVQMNTPMTLPGCMSDQGDPECAAVFANLGLGLASGTCEGDCAGQAAFSVRTEGRR